MQFKLTTDYAIRIILYLHTHKKASSSEMSEKLGISQNYIKKLVTKTTLQKYIMSTPGIHGGFSLCENTKNMSLYDIVNDMELNMFINNCLEDSQKCDGCIAFEFQCPIKNIYQNMQDKIVKNLKSVTFQDLSLDHDEFQKRLGEFICR